MKDHSRERVPPPDAEVFERHAGALRKRAQQRERKGLEHLERGFYLSAAEELREVVETYRNIGDQNRLGSARQYLAMALYEKGDIDEAVAIWEELVGQGWTWPTTLNFLVRHYERVGNTAEVERLYRRLAERERSDAP